MIKMSGQDEKMELIGSAKREYRGLMDLLDRVPRPTDTYSLFPKRLAIATAAYEANPSSWKTAGDFSAALEKYWRRIKIPAYLVPALDDVVNTYITLFGEKKRKPWIR